jgi:ubiquinone/menaquinone biosynthesis C-methylase UbiE/ADP-ribose pyrophosphatase YjhB (NUDIX family)
MPTVLTSALLMEGDRVLLAQRRDASPPFAGQWVLPFALPGEMEAAEECLVRMAESELGVTARAYGFAETLYLSESGRGGEFVANVFRLDRWEGRLRYRAGGDYEEVRWVDAGELSSLPMPLPLRRWLLTLVRPGAESAAEVDVRAAWNAIARSYQARHKISTDVVHYGPSIPNEDELGLVGDVRGKRVLEIGCGGGQCTIAFARRGALAVGKDLSDEQVAFARELAASEGVEARFYQGSVEDLSEFPDASQDVVFSACAMAYVPDIASCFSEVHRVLKPGGVFAFSQGHPMANALSDEGPPWIVERSYWDAEHVWRWELDEQKPLMRTSYRPVGELFQHLVDAGFVVERILEPQPIDDPKRSGFPELPPDERDRLVPSIIIFKARKPA